MVKIAGRDVVTSAVTDWPSFSEDEVPSVTVAREIFDGYRARLPALQEAFPA